jgi:hypothetical protein
MIKTAGAFTLATIAVATAQETANATCAASPQARANFISSQMIRALDEGKGGLKSEGWMIRVLRDAESHSERLMVVCAANPELSLASAIGLISTPTVASAAPAR